jgi:hypothetical protein
MRLRDMQRALGVVLRQRDATQVTNDPELAAYLASVATSGRVEILTHIIRSWCAYDIARACPLTAIALRARGRLEQTLDALIREPVPSPFIERLADSVLARLGGHDDPLVASVAQFERAYLAVRRGSDQRFSVWWDREPLAALAQILRGSQIGDGETGVAYLMTLSRDLPNMFEITPRTTAGLEASH